MNLRTGFAPLLFAAALALGSDKAPVTDDTLNDKVKIKLAADNDVKGGALGIDVKNGVVTLTGKVETEKQKGKAERLARKVSGVKSVQNQIQVAPR